MTMPQLCRHAILILAVLVGTLAGCKPREPVRIGFLGCLSGRNADLGIAGLNGVTLAVENANRSGGINGATIEIIAKDDEQNPETAVRQVESLIKSGVRIIIGPMTSSMAAAILPTVNRSGTILLSPTVTSTDFSGKDDNFLRICGDVSEYAVKSSLYQFDRLGKRKVAVIYDSANSSYTERWLAAFKKSFEDKGGQIVAVFDFASGSDRTFLDTSRKALAGNTDLVLVLANTVDASSIVQQLRKLKPEVSIALAEWAATERFIELTGSYSEGIHVSQFFKLDDSSPAYLSFVDEYRKRFSLTPLFPSLASYDAAHVAIRTLASKGTPPKETIIAIGRFQGLQETITIDRYGDSRRATYLSVIRNRRYLPLE
jgi:branched-chain amino acid transport system substrate-binding protein